MIIELIRRLAPAVLSGIGVGIIQQYDFFYDYPGGEFIFYGTSGLAFAAGVLFPYLQRNDRVRSRALALVIASSISYYVAVQLAANGPYAAEFSGLSFTIASVAGAAIVMAALVLATPIRATRGYVILGVAAGLIGGPVTYLTLPQENLLPLVSGHAAWHTLVGLAIYFGMPKSNEQIIE